MGAAERHRGVPPARRHPWGRSGSHARRHRARCRRRVLRRAAGRVRVTVRRRAVRADHGRAKLGARRAARAARPPGGLRRGLGVRARKKASEACARASRVHRDGAGGRMVRRMVVGARVTRLSRRLSRAFFAPPGSGTRPDGGLARAGVRARPARAAGRAGPHAAVVVRRGHAAGRAAAGAGGSRRGGVRVGAARRRPEANLRDPGRRREGPVTGGPSPERIEPGGGGRTPRARYHPRSRRSW